MKKVTDDKIGILKNQPNEVVDPISEKLKSLYREVEDQTIPDRFLDLLEKLDAAEAKQGQDLSNE